MAQNELTTGQSIPQPDTTAGTTRTAPAPSLPGRFDLTKILLTLLFAFIAFLFFVPLYWMVLNSFRPQPEIFASGANLFPTDTIYTLSIYQRLFTEVPFVRWFTNSVLQSLGYGIVSVALCTMGGYALAKYRFFGRNVLFFTILGSQMIPFHLLIVSLFVILVNLNLLDSYLGAILPLAAHPFGIFFMRQFMIAVNDELLSAARVDGANDYQTFLFVAVPIARPAIAALFILFSLEYWNNLLWPLIVFQSEENMPLTVGIATLVNGYRSSFDLVMAASTLATIPILLLFVLLRKEFMTGMAATGTGIK